MSLHKISRISRTFAVFYICLMMTSCAYYSINIEMADGTIAKGNAFVLNNSEDVQLTVESEAFTASFGKVGTDGTAQAQIITEAISGAVDAAVGL